MAETAFIHIGTEKTGTTTIQDFLVRNRAVLESAGYCLPVEICGQNHTRFAAYAMADDGRENDLHLRFGIRNAQARARFDAELAADLARTMERAASAHSLLISSEHLHSRLRTTGELAKLKALLDRHVRTCKVIVYLRRQDELAVSRFSTRLKAGNAADAPIFPNPRGRLPVNYDYAALLDRIAEVFGEDNMIVRLYDRSQFVGGDLLSDFRAATGIDQALELDRPERRNLSLSAVGLRFLEVFNRHVPDRIDGRMNPDRQGLVPIMEAHYAGRSSLVARADAEAFYDRFREGNAAVKARFFPDLQRDTLFDEDFSAYPESPEAVDCGFEDAVEVAARLWTSAARELQQLRAENRALREQLAKQGETGGDDPAHFQSAVDGLKTAPDRGIGIRKRRRGTRR